MTPCHSQLNYYRAPLKLWAISTTNGERTCGKVRVSQSKPGGEKLNRERLTFEQAMQVALRQPDGGIVHRTSSGSADVYSAQLVRHYRELLAQVKHRQFNETTSHA